MIAFFLVALVWPTDTVHLIPKRVSAAQPRPQGLLAFQNGEVQGNGKRAVLYGLVTLSFDLAYSRCCFGGSDNHFGFLEFICAHSLCYSFACTVADLQALSLSILFSTL